MVALNMPDAMLESLVAEPLAARRERVSFTERIKKLEHGREILRSIMNI